MSDATTTPETAPAADASARPSLLLRAQYVKDLSFENPRAPGSLFGVREQPAMEININLGAQKLDENTVELAMQITLRAVADKTTLFLSDLVYAGILELRNVPEVQIEQAIFVGGAQLIYPFARRVLADVTRDGGFPAVQLEPIDFQAMFNDRRPTAGNA